MISTKPSLVHTSTLHIPAQANPNQHPLPSLSLDNTLWLGSFQAMASECQILLEGVNQAQAESLLSIAAIETWRIEHKFSRYKTNNIMGQINNAYEAPALVDKETQALLNYADQCFQLSEGMFDVTAGILRKIWKFDGSDRLPSVEKINTILPFIGWQKVSWKAPFIQLAKDMELDFGGIGKEYAVDRVCLLLQQENKAKGVCSILVNFGGDLACSGPRLSGAPWEVAVENHHQKQQAAIIVKLSNGAIATSGDSTRFLLKNGVRYSHILNPKTGQSISDAPHSISVAAPTCMQAGMLSTMAMLQGEHAEDFLTAQESDFWVQR